jgi:hypothetical protein
MVQPQAGRFARKEPCLGAPLSWECIYCGKRMPTGDVLVWAEETKVNAVAPAAVYEKVNRMLPLHLEIQNLSPAGFDWGNEEAGSAQLAVALLFDVLNDTKLVVTHYQNFNRQVVCKLGDSWLMPVQTIREFIAIESGKK